MRAAFDVSDIVYALIVRAHNTLDLVHQKRVRYSLVQLDTVLSLSVGVRLLPLYIISIRKSLSVSGCFQVQKEYDVMLALVKSPNYGASLLKLVP